MNPSNEIPMTGEELYKQMPLPVSIYLEAVMVAAKDRNISLLTIRKLFNEMMIDEANRELGYDKS